MKRCACGATYTADGWAALPFVTNHNAPSGEIDSAGVRLQFRLCRCGSTLAVALGDTMKTDAIREALMLLRKVGDYRGMVESAAKAAEDELAALTPPTPDDVARDVDDLRLFIAATGVTTCKTGCECKPHSALDRLASAAAQGARVPGLEESLSKHQNMVQMQHERITEWKAKAFTAEAERDAAQQEAEAHAAMVDAWSDALGLEKTDGYDKAEAIREERDALRIQAATLEADVADARRLYQEEWGARRTAESERDAARQERDAARREVEKLRSRLVEYRSESEFLHIVLSRVANRFGHSWDMNSNDLTRESNALTTALSDSAQQTTAIREQVSKLTARVAELEAELAGVDAKADGAEQNHVKALETLAEVINERDTARQEVEALRRNVAELDGKWREVMWHAMGRDPAQEVGSMLSLSREVSAVVARATAAEATARELAAQLKAWANKPAPAQAGLLEAVDVERLVFSALQRHGLSLSLCTEAAREVRAAFDAAKAGEAVPLKQDVDTVREALDALAEAAPKPWHTEAARAAGIALDRIAKVLGLDTPPGPGGGNTCQHSETFWDASGPCGMCGADPESPPKQNAEVRDKAPHAPEPTVSVAALAAVVEDVVCEAFKVGMEGRTPEECTEAGAREVLRRVTANPPRVLTEARVAEVLGRHSPKLDLGLPPEFDRGWDACLTSIARELGVTLPGGPDNPPADSESSGCDCASTTMVVESATLTARLTPSRRLTFADGAFLDVRDDGTVVLPPESEWSTFFERLEETPSGLMGHKLGTAILLRPAGETCGPLCIRPKGHAGVHELPGEAYPLSPSPRTRRPEPTPEGPALAPEFEGSLSAPSTLEANLKPGSNSTPEVVLNFTTGGPGKEHLRVLAAGALEYETRPGLWVPSVNETGKVLARALAEAKRDMPSPSEIHEMRKAHGAVQSAITSKTITHFGVGVLVIPLDIYEADKRRAAESMRERAELVLYEAATQTRHPEQRDCLLALGHTIRALLLEDE